MDNWTIAQQLTRRAHDLEAEPGHLYRLRAYRQAAQTIMALDEPVEEILAEGGRKRLRELPGVGSHLAVVIENLVRTGEFRTFNEVQSREQPVGA
jgi:DNA polymerase (family 10)